MIPAYNEAGGISAGIDAIQKALRGWTYEIIVVDDGSTDDTARMAETHAVQVVRLGANTGYGAALKAGIALAKFDWIAIIDADATYPASALPGMLALTDSNDMVVGARIGAQVRDPLVRRPAKWLLRKFAGILAGQSIPDLNSGLRVIRKSRVGEFHRILPAGFSFTTTITLAMICSGYPVAYVPIDYFKRVGKSKIRPFHALKFAYLIVRTVMIVRPTLAPAARILGSALLLLALLFIFPIHKLAHALTSIPPSTIAAALPIYVSLHVLGSLKWQWMVSRPGAPVSTLEALRCYFGGLFSNLFLPSVIGGDVVIIALGISGARKTGQVVSGTVASRMIDLAALGLLLATAVFAFPRELDSTAQQLIQSLLLALLGFSILAGAALFLVRRKIRARATKYWQAFAAAWQNPWRTLAALALSLAMQTGLIALSAWIGAGCGIHLPARAWLFAWPLAKLSGFVPVTLAGIGSRELVLPALLAPFGADPAAAASVGLAWDAVLVGGSLVGGAISKGASLAKPQPV